MDKTYGPTARNHFYLPVFYHNRTAQANKHKSSWCLKENEQFCVFKLADEGWWLCEKNDALFSIIENGHFVVGNDEEVLSFFAVPSNPGDVWHGFPVKSDSKRPSSELLDVWIREEIIEHATRIRIERGQL